MEICNLCGEYKKVRKRYSYYGGYANFFDYICEDCDKALIIQSKLKK